MIQRTLLSLLYRVEQGATLYVLRLVMRAMFYQSLMMEGHQVRLYEFLEAHLLVSYTACTISLSSKLWILLGDIRSRLIRLIPTAPEDSPLDRIRNLLAYRLSPESSEREARDEWRDIVEGKSPLWAGIPTDRKEVIRGPCNISRNQIQSFLR